MCIQPHHLNPKVKLYCAVVYNYTVNITLELTINSNKSLYTDNVLIQYTSTEDYTISVYCLVMLNVFYAANKYPPVVKTLCSLLLLIRKCMFKLSFVNLILATCVSA